MTNRFINPRPQFTDNAGNPLPKAEMNFYENGTLIRKDTFSDVNEDNKNANPVLLDADGSMPNVFYAGTARVILNFDPGTGLQQRFDVDGVGQFGSGAAFDDFNSITEYEDGAIVVASDGQIYRSLQNNNTGNDPTASPSFWEQVEFIRTFNVNVTYGIDNIAKASNGLIFRSLQANNLNNDPLTSPSFWGTPVAFVDLNILGDLSFASTELTIAAGSVAAETSHHTIDTEADAASDNLDTITVAGVADFTLLFLRLADAARVVTLKDNAGNIQTKNNEDIILDANIPTVLFRVGTDWFEVQRPVVDNPFDQLLNTSNEVEFSRIRTNSFPPFAGDGIIGVKQSSADKNAFIAESSVGDKWLRMGHNGTDAIVESTFRATGPSGDLVLQQNSGAGASLRLGVTQSSLTKTILKPDQPMFSATANLQPNVTGAGTEYIVLFANERYDQDSNFSSPTFTAPVTGKYSFTAILDLFLVDTTTADTWDMRLVTSNKIYRMIAINTNNLGISLGLSLAVDADMDALDTAHISIRIDGMAGDTADIDSICEFSGHLIG